MKRYLIISGFALLLIYGCNPQFSNWRDYGNKKSNFVQASDIKSGEKLKKEHKDDEFVYNNYIIEVGFEKNKEYEEWLQKSKEKKRKFTKLKWIKNNKNLTIELNDEFSESEIVKLKEWYEKQYFGYYSYGKVNTDDIDEQVEEIKRGRNTTPPGQYLSNVKNSFEVTSLQDFNSYDISIPFSGGEKITGLTVDYGRGTFEPSHSISPYEQNGIFNQDLDIYGSSVYMPVLGSRAYVDYSQEYGDLKYNTSVYIAEPYFQERKVVSFAIPTWLDITLVEKNFEGLTFTKTASAVKPIKKKVVKNVSDNGETAAVSAADETLPSKPAKKGGKPASKAKPKSGVKYVTYEFKNVPAMDYKSSRSSRGASYNYPHFLIQYNFVTEGTSQKPLTGTTVGLYKWYSELVKGLENDTAALGNFTRKLIENKNTDDEKIKSIYYWVEDNIHYLAFEDGIAGFKPEECKDVYLNRYGDCKGMANLLVNMLHIAGFDARRVWIGTRHLNYDYSTPSLAVNNHMIAAIKKDTNYLFLDGTESWCALKQYANRIQGRQVMVENGDTFELVKIPEFAPEYNLETINVSCKMDGKKLLAKSEKTFIGESRLDFIRSMNSLELQNREKALYNFVSDGNISIKPSNIVTSDISNREGKANISYDLELENHVIESNGKKYVNLDWERMFEDLEFDTGRRSDFDFDTKLCMRSETKLELGNLKPEYIPETVMVDNEFYKIILNIRQQGNVLIYKREYIAKQAYLPVSELKNWNAIQKKMNVFYNDYVILK